MFIDQFKIEPIQELLHFFGYVDKKKKEYDDKEDKSKDNKQKPSNKSSS